MSIFSIKDYKVNGYEMDIYVDSSKLEGYEDIKVIFRNRRSKERIYCVPIVKRKQNETVVMTEFKELNFSLEKNILDLAFEINGKEERIYKDTHNENEILNIDPSKSINIRENYIGIPYLTAKSELSILISNNETGELFENFSGRAYIDNILVEHNTISFDFVNFYKELAKKVSIILSERSSKKEWRKDIDSRCIINNRITVDLMDFINEDNNYVSRWDSYIEVVYDHVVIRNKIGKFGKGLLSKSNRYYNCIDTEEENIICPYLTTKNEVSLLINNKDEVLSEKLESNISLNKLDMKKSVIIGEVEIEVVDHKDYKVDSAIIKLRSDIEDRSYKIPTESKRISGNISIVKFSLNLCQYELDQFYWDLFVIININDEKYKIKVKNPTNEVKDKIDNKIVKFSYTNKEGYLIYPYISRVKSLAISYRKKAYYESNLYKVKENIAYYTYRLFKGYFDKKDIWIGYEKFSEGAQDNGFYFFDYCYRNNKKKNFYYIIKKSSNDFENVKHMKDKVLEFMSFKYMVYMYAAKLLISSESKGHSYDVRIEKGKLRKALDKKKIVFLQHGVIALKKIDYIFNKKKGNVVNLFVVSSEYEKGIIRSHFGYREDEILNTGLCRWDVLEDKSDRNNREILLMPTWRSWMDGIAEEKFMETDYYKSYFDLLNSHRLQEMIEMHNIKLKFFIHPKFKEYIGKFSTRNKNINIYEYGEVKVNDLLMKSSMLITDYSSVAWDMYYQKKPIVFYQFDIEDYNKYQGSYLNMETELFGDQVFEAKELIQTIQEYIARDFKEKDEYANIRSKYFTHIDKNNCERTYNAIVEKIEMLKR